MFKDKNIICISNTTWFGKYTKSTVQLLSILARENKVLFIEYPYTIKDVFDAILGKKKLPLGRILGYKKRLTTITIKDDVKIHHLIMPPMLPFAFAKNKKTFETLLKLNSWVYAKVANKFSKKLNFEERTVINAYNPLYGLNLLGKLKENLTAYYCYDITETHRYGKRITHIEKEFTKQVDVVITSSTPLNEKKIIDNPNSFTVTNGVDFELFEPFSKKEINQSKSKVVGYVGSLDNRFDIDTMEYVIQKLNHIKFEFTGNIRNKAIKTRLEKFKNVAFNPPIVANKVPELLASFDLGIIPYIMNEQNKNIYPLKINEYLAIGLPVVINAFADLPDFKNIIHMANTPDAFLKDILIAIKNDATHLMQERVNFAKKQSWEHKARAFGYVLEDHSKFKHRTAQESLLKLT